MLSIICPVKYKIMIMREGLQKIFSGSDSDGKAPLPSEVGERLSKEVNANFSILNSIGEKLLEYIRKGRRGRRGRR